MNLGVYTLKTIAYAIVNNPYSLVLIILAVTLYFKNRGVTAMQKAVVGQSLQSTLELTLSQLVIGIFGGALASVMISYMGIMFNEKSGIELLFLVSLLLILVKPRFVCFSYSGAVIGIISLVSHDVYRIIYGKALISSFNINIVALMSLVGILHIVEGLMVMLDGYRGAIPVFTNNNGRISGGFAVKRYWPMPIIIMLFMAAKSSGPSFNINLPDWWPLINTGYSAKALAYGTLAMMPMYAIIGYSSVTFTMSKSRKALSSGLCILSYGIVLTLIAQLAPLGLVFKFIVVILAPVLHELMLNIQSRIEFRREPRYVNDDEGIIVLDVVPDSVADKVGIRTGDKLLRINGREIINELDIIEGVKETIDTVMLTVRKANGDKKDLEYSAFSPQQRLGVIFVPKTISQQSKVVGYEENNFKEMLDKLKDDKKDDDK
ncbi:PDZ domain-containing protein [Clostridium oryzae]|uniref:Cell division topological determinant MinJ n=1 Tax=Clostridium oryzae TaxID=1450648 RepID=A0A1V4IYX9_9CLOT|nr:PDZ domain-containing protein [Clostridium oryzae]OPJ65109.1 cell division topological determinant MinJ [Clostridium oryzae]